jgi:hypothetical protein
MLLLLSLMNATANRSTLLLLLLATNLIGTDD